MNRISVYILSAVFVFLALCAIAGMASAQDESKLKVYAGFSNTHSDLYGQHVQGVDASLQYKVYGYEKVKLELVGDFATHKLAGNPSDWTFSYLGGPQVSASLLEGRVNPFARVMFGFYNNDTGIKGSLFMTSIGGGVDINVGKHYFIRPIQYDRQSIETLPLAVHRIGFGGGVRF